MGGACDTYGESRGVYRVCWRNLRGRRPLGRPGSRWKDNIKNGYRISGMGSMRWIDMAPDTDRWRTPLNARVP